MEQLCEFHCRAAVSRWLGAHGGKRCPALSIYRPFALQGVSQSRDGVPGMTTMGVPAHTASSSGDAGRRWATLASCLVPFYGQIGPLGHVLKRDTSRSRRGDAGDESGGHGGGIVVEWQTAVKALQARSALPRPQRWRPRTVNPLLVRHVARLRPAFATCARMSEPGHTIRVAG